MNVNLYKYVHIILGGALCGLGGAYMSLVTIPVWQENVVAGRGWIAVALVIFSGWNPVRAIFGCYLFGILKGMALKFQGVCLSVFGLKLSLAAQIMDMMPYILTVAVLVLTAIFKKGASAGPAGVGKPYFREAR